MWWACYRTYDLIALSLVRFNQFKMLSDLLERSMKFSFKQKHTWEQFALALACEGKHYRLVWQLFVTMMTWVWLDLTSQFFFYSHYLKVYVSSRTIRKLSSKQSQVKLELNSSLRPIIAANMWQKFGKSNSTWEPPHFQKANEENIWM